MLVLYDTSGSIANSWASPADRAAFEAKVAGAIAGAAADKPFEAQVVTLGANPTAGGWRVPDATSLAANLASVAGITSDVWYSLGQVLPASGASVAIMISDDASSLEDPARIDEWKRNVGTDGIPIAVVPLGTVDAAATQLIVDSSGGGRLDPTGATFAADLTAFLKTHAGAAAVTNYRIRYRTTETGPATRHVDVKLAKRPEIHRHSDLHGARGGRSHGAVRHRRALRDGDGRQHPERAQQIAGADVTSRGAVILPLAANAVDETTAALTCMHTLMFEPMRPTTAHLFDDALSALITDAEFVDKAKKGTDALIAALPSLKVFPMVAPLLFDAPAAASDPPLATGLRVVVLGSRYDGKEYLRTVDVVPEFNVWTSTGDAATRFSRALERSLYVSAREAQFTDQSAFADLQGTTWAVLAPGAGPPASWADDVRARFRAVLDQYSSWICLVPADGATPALWVVDPATGSATAVSLDGRGGGSNPGCNPDSDLAAQINFALILISLVCTFAKVRWGAGPGLGIVWRQRASASGVAPPYGSFTSPAGAQLQLRRWRGRRGILSFVKLKSGWGSGAGRDALRSWPCSRRCRRSGRAWASTADPDRRCGSAGDLSPSRGRSEPIVRSPEPESESLLKSPTRTCAIARGQLPHGVTERHAPPRPSGGKSGGSGEAPEGCSPWAEARHLDSSSAR